MVKEMITTIIFGVTVGATLFSLEARENARRDKAAKDYEEAYRKGRLIGEYELYRRLDMYAASPVDIAHEIDRYIVCPYGDETEADHFHFRVDEIK